MPVRVGKRGPLTRCETVKCISKALEVEMPSVEKSASGSKGPASINLKKPEVGSKSSDNGKPEPHPDLIVNIKDLKGNAALRLKR